MEIKFNKNQELTIKELLYMLQYGLEDNECLFYSSREGNTGVIFITTDGYFLDFYGEFPRPEIIEFDDLEEYLFNWGYDRVVDHKVVKNTDISISIR